MRRVSSRPPSPGPGPSEQTILLSSASQPSTCCHSFSYLARYVVFHTDSYKHHSLPRVAKSRNACPRCENTQHRKPHHPRPAYSQIPHWRVFPPHGTMRQPSYRKRVRRLLRLLKDLQEDDTAITPPTVFAIKHLLQLHHRCKLVEVTIDSLTANSPYESIRALLPIFIVSQLEGQKLTEWRSERVLVPPVAGFVIQSLPSVCGRERLYPTLFRWYYPPQHRTYYVFAHITHNMPRRTYTLTELLGLRATQTQAEIMAMSGRPELGKSRQASRLLLGCGTDLTRSSRYSPPLWKRGFFSFQL